MEDRNKIKYSRLEKKWDRCLIKRNNTSSEMAENNLFENYFGQSDLRRVEALIDGNTNTEDRPTNRHISRTNGVSFEI